MAKCFKCEKEMESSFTDDKPIDVWNMPNGGVVFDGGSNFGSSLYDSMIDGISVQIVVCDECLKAHKDLIREIPNGETLSRTDGYTLGRDKGYDYIECNECGKRSFNPGDIAHKYCGHCKKFHDD